MPRLKDTWLSLGVYPSDRLRIRISAQELPLPPLEGQCHEAQARRATVLGNVAQNYTVCGHD